MAEKTYTVFIKAPAGHTGSVPVSISGSVPITDAEGNVTGHNRIGYSKSIPYDVDVPSVPETVVLHLKEQFPDIKYTPETVTVKKPETAETEKPVE